MKNITKAVIPFILTIVLVLRTDYYYYASIYYRIIWQTHLIWNLTILLIPLFFIIYFWNNRVLLITVSVLIITNIIWSILSYLATTGINVPLVFYPGVVWKYSQYLIAVSNPFYLLIIGYSIFSIIKYRNIQASIYLIIGILLMCIPIFITDDTQRFDVAKEINIFITAGFWKSLISPLMILLSYYVYSIFIFLGLLQIQKDANKHM